MVVLIFETMARCPLRFGRAALLAASFEPMANVAGEVLYGSKRRSATYREVDLIRDHIG